MASRILQNLSKSKQSETLMINKFKAVSENYWTSKLENMLKDIEKSEKLMVDFRDEYSYPEFDLNVSICTTRAW